MNDTTRSAADLYRELLCLQADKEDLIGQLDKLRQSVNIISEVKIEPEENLDDLQTQLLDVLNDILK